MVYATTNKPRLFATLPGGGGNVWLYKSTDVHTDVDATDYFTDGYACGMRVNDLLFAIKTDATIGATMHVVTAVTTDGAATVSPAILA